MALLDILFVLFVGVLALLGWRSGLVHESATLVGFALGLVAAGHYNSRVAPLLAPWVHDGSMAELAAFGLILVGTWVLVLVAGAFLRDVLRFLHLGWLDNLGGMAMGTAKGIFMAEIVILALMAMPGEDVHQAITHSWLGSRLAALARQVVYLVPAVLRYWKPF